MRRPPRLDARVTLGMLALALVLACGPQPTTVTERICTPGNYVFCRCKDRSEGTKLCNAEGTGFDACEGCVSVMQDDQVGEPKPDTEPGSDADAGSGGDAEVAVDAASPVGAKPKPGELFVTEIMFDPAGDEPTEEWFEVFSIAATPVVLNGLFILDGAGRAHLLGPLPAMTLAPSRHMVLARNRAAAMASGVPTAAILGEYATGDPDTAGVLLTNGSSGALRILDGATEIVQVPYGSFNFTQPPPGGASIQLKVPNLVQAKLASGWCLSSTVWAGQPAMKAPKDKGTPGAVSNCQ